MNIIQQRSLLFSHDLEECRNAYRALKKAGWNDPKPSETCRMAILDQRFGECPAFGMMGYRYLIHALYLYRSDGEAVDAIFDQLDSAQEPLLIGDLVALIRVRETGIAKRAGKLITDLWSYLSVGDMRRLDLICRRMSPSWYAYMGAEQVDDYMGFLPSSLYEPARTGIASFHGSGYIRERAMTFMHRLDLETRLPLLMIRMTDWVAPVQSMAQSMLRADLERAPLVSLVGVAALRELLRVNTRYQASGFDKIFQQRLNQEKARSAFAQALQDRDPIMRRHVIRLGLSLEHIAESMVFEASQDADPMNRLTVVRWLKSNFSPTYGAVLEQCLEDSFAALRGLAYQTMRTHMPERFKASFAKGLLDQSSGVRCYVQYFAGKAGVDGLAFYASALERETGRKLVAAVQGWAELGGDVKRLEGFLDHERTKVRRAAIRGLSMLDPKHYTAVFQEALLSDNAGVSRQGMDALKYAIYDLPQDWFWQVLAETRYVHVRANVYRLLAMQNKWDAMTALAKGLQEASAVRQVVEQLLWKLLCQPPWVFPKLSAERVSEIEQEWAKLELGKYAGGMNSLLSLARQGKL